MKSTVLILLVLLVSEYFSQQGWVAQQPPPSIGTITKIFACTPDIVYAAADSGKIIKTTDGGDNWKVIFRDDSIRTNIESIFFVDTLLGWAVTWKQILKTTDGGKNWDSYKFNEQMMSFSSVYFINPDTGWVTGGWYGTLYKTVDGGKTWVLKETPVRYNALNDVYFADSKHGFIAASEAGWGIMEHGFLLITSDGGETWNENITENLYSLSFANPEAGWMSGGYYLYFTNDGGKNWESKILQRYINSIFFINNTKGWAITNNVVLNTTDGGESWSKQDSFYSPTRGTNFTSISFFDENTGWIAGSQKDWINGKPFAIIIKTKNGGLSDVTASENTAIKQYSLLQNFPNPFNPVTKIRYTIQNNAFEANSTQERKSLVSLKVYDIIGNEIATLVHKEQSPGEYEVEFDGSTIANGIYLYTLSYGGILISRKMCLVK